MPASSSTQENLLLRIRRETRDLHELLERELNFPGPALTCARYVEVLRRFYGYYLPWERALKPWIRGVLQGEVDLPDKLPDLEQDLEFFSVQMGEMPICSSVPACQTLGEALGNLYVREGSALGGQIISRQLESRLGLSNGAGYQFFGSAGRNVGQQWRQFQRLLMQHSSAENGEAAVISARMTFESIRIWFAQAE